MPTNRKYWLFKSEPSVYSFQDLLKEKDQTACWDGVRNYQARNLMREMKEGDQGFFYHSVNRPVGIYGTLEVVKEAYPDYTSWEKESRYFDPKSSPENPRWFMVDVKAIQILPTFLSLQELKNYSELSEMVLLKKGSRLSIQPVTAQEWKFIVSLAGL